jgi:hypothetical protein
MSVPSFFVTLLTLDSRGRSKGETSNVQVPSPRGGTKSVQAEYTKGGEVKKKKKKLRKVDPLLTHCAGCHYWHG